MEELKKEIAQQISDWKDKKISEIEMDNDTDYEIFETTERYIRCINEQLDDLESEIDSLIEQMSEPSDYEYDMREYAKLRSSELIGG